MPSSIVHLFVANTIKDDLNISDASQFFLGAISTDAVNLNGFASEEIRYTAHLRSKNVAVWLENIKSFVKENKGKYTENPDFFYGFVVHLLTDIGWDEMVQPRLFRELLSRQIPQEQLKTEKWNELYRFNNLLFSHENWGYIKETLSQARPVEISTVSKSMLTNFLQKVLAEDRESSSTQQSDILQFSDIEITSKKVLELCYDIF